MTSSAAHLEPLASLLRVGGAYGEPWTWSVVISWDSPSSVRVLGAQRAPAPSEWRAAVATLRAAGVTAIRFERRRDGQTRTREHVIRAAAENTD